MITDYTRFLAALAAHGVTLDETATEALAVIKAAQAARDAQPMNDLRARYAAGEVTSDNAEGLIIEAAVLAAGADRIRQAAAEMEGAASGTLRRWVGANADRIVKELRPAFDKAAAHVAVAGRHFPPGATPAQLVAAGSDAVAAHEGLDAALSTLDTLRTLRVDVADCAGNTEQDVTWWITPTPTHPLDREAQDNAERLFKGAGNAFHALAHAGFTLRMNTTAEAAKVAAGARAITDAREAAEREAAAAEVRESWRGIIPIAG